MIPGRRRSQPAELGQALAFVALVLAVLVGLAVVGLDVAAYRRAVLRLQDITETAALAGVHDLDAAPLERGAPQIREEAAVPRARAALVRRLRPLRATLARSPEETAAAADIWVAARSCRAGERTRVGGVICLRVRYLVRTAWGGERPYASEAEATWTARP